MLHKTRPIADNPAYLDRPHLYNKLDELLKNPVVAITAGAGYGKTHTVYDFLKRYNAETIWIQLSEFDNLPTRLWENFIYAVSLQNERLSLNLKIAGFPESLQEYDRFLVMFSSEIRHDKKYVLVYDDFHLIHETHVLYFFEKFISVVIPNLSTIIISRTELGINFRGLLSKNMFSVIDEDDFRFSREEMINYFKLRSIELSTKSITDVYNYTEGWVFAIRLVELSLRKGSVSEDYAISVAKQNVFMLIENEVFSTVSKELQGFLVKLSLIDHLPSELIMTLSFNNNELISEMAKISSFIRYDAFFNTYRMHHLFLNFLYEKQFTLKTEEKNDTYSNAADWYANNGYNVDAITYYEKAEQYDKMMDIILGFYAFSSVEMAKFILGILDKLPKSIYNERPFMRIVHAKFVLNCLNFEDSYAETLEVVEKYESMPLTEESKRMLGESYINLGTMNLARSICTGDYSFQKYYVIAKKYLPNGSSLYDKRFQFNPGTYCCCVGRPIKGEFDKFIDAINFAMPYASIVTNGSGLGIQHLCLAEKLYFQMDLKGAEKYAHKAIDESQKKEQYATECIAIFYLVRINAFLGDYVKIVSLLNQLKSVCEKYNTPLCYKMLDITEGWLYSQVKNPDKVADWIMVDVESIGRGTLAADYTLGRFIRAKCYLADQKYYELLYFLDKDVEFFGMDLFLLGLIEKTVIKAVALYQIKETEQALAALQEAYNLASPDDLYMPFVELAGKMRTLANAAVSSTNCTIPNQWLKMISTKSSTYAKKVSQLITEYRVSNSMENDIGLNLTRKELELLTDICHGLSREEIASNLDLSINTVKNMIRIVFEKLGAVNTVDAVRIATLLKLVK